MGHLLTGGPVGGVNILDSVSSEVQEVERVLLTTPVAFFPMSDFTHNSNFMDDPRGVVGNSLVGPDQGPDGILLVRNQVEDNEIRDSAEDSVLSTAEFMLNVSPPGARQSLPSVGFCGSEFSVNQDVSVLAADSGTQFTVLTLSTASLWSGRALAELNFVAALLYYF